MTETKVTVMDVSDNNKIEQPAGVWHYIRVFCSFFSIITSFGAIVAMTEMRSNYLDMVAVLWILGIISALLVSPLKFLKFAWQIISKCAIFGWFLLPFPFDLLSVAVSIVVGVVAAILAVMVCPAIFTIYTYFTDIRDFCVDNKKEIITIISAILAVAVLIGMFFILHGITTAIEAPIIKEKFDPVAAYNTYVDNHPDAKEISEDILSNPSSSTFSEGGYVCTNVYEYEGTEGFVNYSYTDTLKFEYTSGAWKVMNTNEEKIIDSYNAISGDWTITGEYPANNSEDNEITFNILNLTQDGGTGSISVLTYDNYSISENASITMGEIETREVNYKTHENELVTQLSFEFESPIVFEGFWGECGITRVDCEFSLTNNQVNSCYFDYTGL